MARRHRTGIYAVTIVSLLILGALAYKYWLDNGLRIYSAAGSSTGDIGLVGQVAGEKQTALKRISSGKADQGTSKPPSPTGDAPKQQTPPPAKAEPVPSDGRVQSFVAAAEQAVRAEDWADARKNYSQALAVSDSPEQRGMLAGKLQELADKTLFSKTVQADDPLVDTHAVQAGEKLQTIANKYKLTTNLLARMNGLASRNQIQAGQRLKVAHGPFSATVYKSRFEMEVYLGDVLVRRYRVGLGQDGSTPTGEWRVKNKLVNPTYFPPRGGKQIAADDPTNPLGERWIGLEGISGDAVGQEKYGIHGTIEPESIGKNLSMGCIRLLNPDVEDLYDLLVEKESVVTIKP